MVLVLASGSSGVGSIPGRGHCIVFLDKTLYFHCASLHLGLTMVIRNSLSITGQMHEKLTSILYSLQ